MYLLDTNVISEIRLLKQNKCNIGMKGFNYFVLPNFAGRILPINAETAQICAKLLGIHTLTYIENLARLQAHNLIGYTRKVTQVWSGFLC